MIQLWSLFNTLLQRFNISLQRFNISLQIFNISLQIINYTPISYVNANETQCVWVHDQLFIEFNLPMNWCMKSNKEKTISLSRLPLLSLSYKSSYYVDQLIYFSSQRAYVEFHLRNFYDHSLYENTFLGLPKETLCLNLIRYRSVSIKNTYCYRLPLTVTQSIENILSF